MEYAQYVYVRTQFIGYHYWPEAPADVLFLRKEHRHVFHVKLGMRTSKDREVEFITLKRKLDNYLRDNYDGRVFPSSCETIAQTLMAEFNADYVEVSEDGENGAMLVRHRSGTEHEFATTEIQLPREQSINPETTR